MRVAFNDKTLIEINNMGKESKMKTEIKQINKSMKNPINPSMFRFFSFFSKTMEKIIHRKSNPMPMIEYICESSSIKNRSEKPIKNKVLINRRTENLNTVNFCVIIR